METKSKIYIGALFFMAVIGVTAALLYQPPVNGDSTIPQLEVTKIRVYLGEEIPNNFYYHGVLAFNPSTLTHTASEYIVIGDWHGGFRKGGMSNMYIKAEKDMTFRLGDKTFRLVDYAGDWIELEELK